MNVKTLTKDDLRRFTGDDHVFRHPMLNKRYTEGVRHVAEAGGAYWLLDIVFSHQIDPKAKAEEFQVWRLKREGGGCIVWMTDGNSETPVIRQDVEFTDFPLDEIMFFYENDTLCLPAER